MQEVFNKLVKTGTGGAGGREVEETREETFVSTI